MLEYIQPMNEPSPETPTAPDNSGTLEQFRQSIIPSRDEVMQRLLDIDKQRERDLSALAEKYAGIIAEGLNSLSDLPEDKSEFLRVPYERELVREPTTRSEIREYEIVSMLRQHCAGPDWKFRIQYSGPGSTERTMKADIIVSQ